MTMGLCKHFVHYARYLYIYIVFVQLDCVLSIAVFEIIVFILKIQRYAHAVHGRF